MLTKVKAVLMSSTDGDWEALYVDGKLVAENHRLDAGEVLDALFGDDYEYVEVSEEIAESGFSKTLKEQLRKK